MKKVGCFFILLVLIGLYILGSFVSEENDTSPAEKTAPVLQETLITTPRNINRDAKELDWFETPESQNLKVGDFIVVSGHPGSYIGAVAEPHGDELFPTFKLTYGKPCNLFILEHWIYPPEGEICQVWVRSDVDFAKIRAVRDYNSARQISGGNDLWLKKRELTLIVEIKSIEYVKYNDEIGNLWSIDAHYISGDMLRY